MNVEVVKIGDGNQVCDQYPKNGDSIYSGGKVFVLTDSPVITIPDFTSWTRKDVVNFWNMSKLPITIEGYGVAYEQSISPNTVYDGASELKVKLKDIQYVEEVLEPEVPEELSNNEE